MAAMAQTQDDLVNLFARNLSLCGPNPSIPDQQFDFPSDRSRHVVYASTHYVPSYTFSQQTSMEDSDPTVHILQHNGINPAHLFPCQLHLFTQSSAEQRVRLLELWRTAGIRASDMAEITQKYGDLTHTNLLQEEVMARLRYERNLAEQKADSAQRPTEDAEPYMVSGYSAVAVDEEQQDQQQRPAGSGVKAAMWDVPRRDEQVMEDQYGAFLAARDFERFQQLHDQVQAAGSMDATVGMMDEEMVA